MTVKELIKKLQKCNQNATVCVESYSDVMANEVKEFDGCVYIGDDLTHIMNEEKKPRL